MIDDEKEKKITNNGKIFNDQWRENLSVSHIGLPGPNTGKKFDKKWCDNLSKSKIGNKLSDEHKKKLSDVKKGKRPNNSKLNFVKAEEIRSKFAAGNVTKKSLAIEYGIGESVIYKVLDGLTYTKPD